MPLQSVLGGLVMHSTSVHCRESWLGPGQRPASSPSLEPGRCTTAPPGRSISLIGLSRSPRSMSSSTQSRVRTWPPVPQVALQPLHSPQPVQLVQAASSHCSLSASGPGQPAPVCLARVPHFRFRSRLPRPQVALHWTDQGDQAVSWQSCHSECQSENSGSAGWLSSD